MRVFSVQREYSDPNVALERAAVYDRGLRPAQSAGRAPGFCLWASATTDCRCPWRRLNLYCIGEDSPTVLFDSGLGDGILSWCSVQGVGAKSTRAYSYDRANYFYSDTVQRKATAQAAVGDLLGLIDSANLGDRIILVGHSRSGLNARPSGCSSRPRSRAGPIRSRSVSCNGTWARCASSQANPNVDSSLLRQASTTCNKNGRIWLSIASGRC